MDLVENGILEEGGELTGLSGGWGRGGGVVGGGEGDV